LSYRLTKIYTRNGDQGNTRLANAVVPKNAKRIIALGELDELNCALGVLLTQAVPQSLRELILTIQQLLFELGAELAVPGTKRIQAEDVTRLENHLDQLNTELPPLTEFVLPGGTPAAAHCHLARAICRRCERALVALMQQDTLNADSLSFINRLSDLLFVIARVLQANTANEVLWQPRSFHP